MTNYDKVKIVVVGDSGVGKTSAVSLICRDQAISSPSWTVGVSLEVKLHDYKAGTPQQKQYYVDLWDVGGSSSHRNSRSVFYNGVNGIILVHDLTNRKSETNLQKWIMEILNRDREGTGSNSKLDEDFDPEQFVGSSQIPILVIGTKMDGIDGYRPTSGRASSSSIADECGAEEIRLNCLDPKSLSPGSTASVKISKFFDKVIERRFCRDSATHAFYDKRKVYSPNNVKMFNEDYY